MAQSREVVKRISDAFSTLGLTRSATSFFKPYDRDNTGALTFASFASGLESLQSATGVVLGGDDVGRLLRDFDGGNGFVSYRKLCDLIESMRMSEAVFGRKLLRW